MGWSGWSGVDGVEWMGWGGMEWSGWSGVDGVDGVEWMEWSGWSGVDGVEWMVWSGWSGVDGRHKRTHMMDRPKSGAESSTVEALIHQAMLTCAPASASEGQHRQRGAAGLGWKICEQGRQERAG
eukprot:362108-Chlamydomonas_euryale.AAC.4